MNVIKDGLDAVSVASVFMVLVFELIRTLL